LNALTKYLDKFGRLNQGVTKYGKAPHKIVLLITVLQAFRNKLITQNKIYVSPELVALFKGNWNALVTTNHVCNFALPFWHLRGKKSNKEPFWILTPKSGFESVLFIKESISSLGELNAAVNYAKLSEDLFTLVKNTKDNLVLQQFLLDKYFPDSKNNFSNSFSGQKQLFNDIEMKIMNESPEEYQKEIKKLLTEKNDEEIYIRGSLFKREIPKIYNNTCCISGMKIDATVNVSMIDACHIVPFSESYNDTVTNGIALCPNLHRAFDRGLIAVDENYKVVVSNTFMEVETSYSIRSFEGKDIQLPKMKSYYPLMENFEWHRNNIYKA